MSRTGELFRLWILWIVDFRRELYRNIRYLRCDIERSSGHPHTVGHPPRRLRVFTHFRASKPALNFSTCSIVPSGYSASTCQCSPSFRTTQNIGVRAVTFSHTRTAQAVTSGRLVSKARPATSRSPAKPRRLEITKSVFWHAYTLHI
jgi:hypothetical protein